MLTGTIGASTLQPFNPSTLQPFTGEIAEMGVGHGSFWNKKAVFLYGIANAQLVAIHFQLHS
jgi:hypothetical protein